MSFGSINMQGSNQQQGHGAAQGGYPYGLQAGSIHTATNLQGSISTTPGRIDALLAFAAAAFSGVYASDLSLVLSDQEKVAKAWDFAELMLAEGQKRGHNFY